MYTAGFVANTFLGWRCSVWNRNSKVNTVLFDLSKHKNILKETDLRQNIDLELSPAYRQKQTVNVFANVIVNVDIYWILKVFGNRY